MFFNTKFTTDEWWYVTNQQEYDFAVEYLEQRIDLAFDTETYVLPIYKGKKSSKAIDPHCSRVSLLILASEETKNKPFIFDIIILRKNKVCLKRLIQLLVSRRSLIAFKAQFDVKFIFSEFGVWLDNVRCVQLQAKLMGNATGSKAGRKRGYSLQDVVRDYLSIHLKKGKGNVDWFARPILGETVSEDEWLDRLKYAAEDVKYLFDLDRILTKVLSDPLPHTELVRNIANTSTTPPYGLGMKTILDLEMQIAAVAGKLEYNGLPASRKLMRTVELSNYDPSSETGEMIRVAAELCQDLGLETRKDHWTNEIIPSREALNSLNSTQKLKKILEGKLGLGALQNVQASFLERTLQIIQLLYETKESEGDEEAQESVYSNAEEEELYKELELLEASEAMERSEMLTRLLKYKRLAKQNSMQLSKHINPITNRIHSSFDPLGAATGRSSCIAKGTLISLAIQSETDDSLYSDKCIYKPIEEVEPGDIVITIENIAEPPAKAYFTVAREVKSSILTGSNREVIRLHWRDEKITDDVKRRGYLDLTPEHPVFVIKGLHTPEVKGEWIQAQDLQQGDRLFTTDPLTVSCVDFLYVDSIEDLEKRVDVYDLEIEDTHSFIAGGVLVHNSASPNQQNVSGRSKIPVAIHIDELFASEGRTVECLHRPNLLLEDE